MFALSFSSTTSSMKSCIFFYPHMTYKFEGFKQMLQLSSAFAFILS